MNPLIITVNQSINYTFYACVITINNHDPSNCPHQIANEIAISVKGNVNLVVNLMLYILIDTFVRTVMTTVNLITLFNTSQQLECHTTTNTDIEPLQKGVVRVWSAYARPSWSTRINMAHSFIHKIL